MLHTASQLRGYAVAALDGLTGRETDILFDDRDWRVCFFVIRTDGWLTRRNVLVPPESVKGLSDWRGVLVTDLTRRQVENEPSLAYEPRPDPRADLDALWCNAEMWPSYWGPPLLPEVSAVDSARCLEAEPHVRSCRELGGYRLRTREGDIGHIKDFIVDPDAWVLRFLVVATRNWLPGGQCVLVETSAVEFIDDAAGRIQVAFGRAGVNAAPKFDPAQFHLQH